MKIPALATASACTCYGLAQPGERALEPSQHFLHAAARHHLHHFLGLLELRQQTVDFLHADTRAAGDSPLARGLEDLGLGALLRGHRIDNPLEPADLLVVD